MNRKPAQRSLMFSPLAFLKLTYFCHAAGTEVGGFGISDPANPLHIQDMVLIKQCSTLITTELDDEAVADHLEEQALLGIPPNRCGRIWIHTHPGSSPHPSMTDEQTFDRCFSGCDWSVMAILARGGDSYARLAIQTGPGAEVILPVEIDWSAWPRWVNEQGQDLPHLAKHWQHELQSLIVEPPAIAANSFGSDCDLLEEMQWQHWFDAQQDQDFEKGFMEALSNDE